MSHPRHEALVAAAILGVVKAHAWMRVPLVVDVNAALAAAGGAEGVARMNRRHAIMFTRGLIDRICEAEGWEKLDSSDVENEQLMAVLFGQAYDELIGATA